METLLALLLPRNWWLICEQRLATQKSAKNYLLLARAYTHQEKWDKVGEETQAALKMEPGNYVAHLNLLALALKQSSNTVILTRSTIRRTVQHVLTMDLVPGLRSNAGMKFYHTGELATLDKKRPIANGLVDLPEYKKSGPSLSGNGPSILSQ